MVVVTDLVVQALPRPSGPAQWSKNSVPAAPSSLQTDAQQTDYTTVPAGTLGPASSPADEISPVTIAGESV